IVVYFFFQAADGIRDFHVTGVQTCALPILRTPVSHGGRLPARVLNRAMEGVSARSRATAARPNNPKKNTMGMTATPPHRKPCLKIGRASCRERAQTPMHTVLLPPHSEYKQH